MTLTDRIAKKLYELNEIRACGRVRRPWSDVNSFGQGCWRAEARHVLGDVRDAVRQPTVEVILAGADVPDSVGRFWPGMIDVALADDAELEEN